MNVTSKNINELIEELLAILDADAEHLESALNHLNNLREGVIKRNEPALEQLLESIKGQQEGRETIESRRQELRRIAAARFGCRADQVNLSRFMQYLPEGMRQKITQRKATLEQLIAKLKTEYMGTAMLLSECTRFNRILIDSIMGSRCGAATVYNANGQAQRPSGSGFVTMQF